jgi:hypothetical protein
MPPAIPALELPVVTVTPPPVLAPVPVDNIMPPDASASTSSVIELGVLNLMEPVVPQAAVPEVRLMSPPVVASSSSVQSELPAVILISEPAPEVLVPTAKVMPLAVPNEASPVDSDMAPLEPVPLPVVTEIAPEWTAGAALIESLEAVLSVIAPVTPRAAEPEVREMEPPVRASSSSGAAPAVMATPAALPTALVPTDIVMPCAVPAEADPVVMVTAPLVV